MWNNLSNLICVGPMSLLHFFSLADWLFWYVQSWTAWPLCTLKPSHNWSVFSGTQCALYSRQCHLQDLPDTNSSVTSLYLEVCWVCTKGVSRGKSLLYLLQAIVSNLYTWLYNTCIPVQTVCRLCDCCTYSCSGFQQQYLCARCLPASLAHP